MTRLFRAFVFLSLGLLLGGTASYSFAGYAQLKAPANIGGTVGARTTSGSFAANNGNISVGFTTQVAGQTVTMPAVMRLAANAGQFAVSALRLNPAALVGTAVLAYLADKGISYIDGQFMKANDSSGQIAGGFEYACGGYVGPITAAAAQTCAAIGGWGTISEIEYIEQTPGLPTTAYLIRAKSSNFGGGPWGVAVFSHRGTCPAGTTMNGTQCVGAAVPAGQADWDAVAASPLPVPVAQELAAKGVPLPLQNPEFDPTPQTVPLSNPYPKPGGQPGETVRDVAKVTPAPNETAKIETQVEPVTDSSGNPIVNPTPDPTQPTEQSKFCVENPDALACWKEGEPENVDLETDTKNVVITPQGGWGPDTGSCPQPRKHVLKNGYTVQMSWEPVCDGAGMFRPVVLGLAWLAAIYAFLAMHRKSQA